MPVRDLLSAASGASAPSDPYFEYNTLLLNGDGTNGAQNNTFLDSSTNNFTITRNGNTTQGSFSPYGNLWSNYFNGSTAYLNTSASAGYDFGTGAFTIEAWINISAFITNSGQSYPDDWIVAAYDGTSVFPWVFRVGDANNAGNSKRLNFSYDGFATQLNSSTDLTVGEWTHVAVSCSGSTVSVFQNGTRVATASISGITSASGTAKGFIGGTEDYSRFLNGYISNVRVVKGTDVYGASNTTITVPTTPLTAVSGTQLLTCQSNRFIDNSSNAFAITVNGTPSVQRFSPFNPTAPYSTSVIGGSGYFDGSGDYLNNSSSTTLSGDFTAEAWFYVTSLAASKCIFTIGDTSLSSGLECLVNTSGEVRLYANSAYLNQISAGIKVNTWYHIAVVRTSGSIKTYVNGTSLNTVSYSSSLSGNFYIGAENYSSSASTYWSGYISNFRITNTSVYSTDFTPPTSPVTAISGTQLLANFTNAGIPDLAMQNNLETVGNAQVSTSVKKYGTGSLSFDGTGDLLTFPTSTMALGSGAYTIEFWIYPTSLPSGGGHVIAANANNGLVVLISTTKTALNKFGVGDVVAYNTALSTNTWTHVAIVREGTGTNQTKIYINGTAQATGTDNNNWTVTTSSAIGGNSSSSSQYITGYLDDFRITYGLARYTANFTPPTAALPTY